MKPKSPLLTLPGASRENDREDKNNRGQAVEQNSRSWRQVLDELVNLFVLYRGKNLLLYVGCERVPKGNACGDNTGTERATEAY